MAAKKPLVLGSDGLPEQLQTGDTLEGAGGATAAGLTGEVQFKGADGNLAASPYFKAEEHVDLDIPSFSGFRMTMAYGASNTLFDQRAGVLNVVATNSFIGYQADGIQFTTAGGSYFNLDDTTSDFAANGTFNIQASDITIAGSSSVSLFCVAGSVTISTGTPTGTNVPGYGVVINGGNSHGNASSRVSVYTAVGGASGSASRVAAEHYYFEGLSAVQKFDASNYWTSTINSTGGLSMQGVGAGGSITLSPTSGQKIYLGGSTNGVEVDSAGEMKFLGTATIWDDVLPTNVIQLTGVGSPNITLVGTSTVLRAQEFPNVGATEEYNATWQMPHGWKEGSDIGPHIHLYIPDDGTGGAIQFTMIYSWENMGSTSATETTITGSITRVANAGIASNIILPFTAIAGTGKTISSILRANIKRTQGGADTFGGTCWLLQGDVHIEKDTIGSKTSTAK